MRKYILAAVLFTILLFGIWAYTKYLAHTRANVHNDIENPYLFVPTGSGYEELVDSLTKNGFLKDEKSFREYAAVRKFGDEKVKGGRYKIKGGWSNHELLEHLMLGKQETLNLTFNNARLVKDIASQVAKYIEPDSTQLYQYMSSEKTLSEYGLNRQTAMTLYIPNTYNFYWTTTPKAFVERMAKEHDRFWKQNDRLAKAKTLGLSPVEVYTLASIVEKETRLNSEKPIVAGLYLNRIRKGMLLQADPTAVFATGDFTARRVLNKHINYDSPYNTYKYAGLPPGPIYMPSITAIDAVLNPAKHEYYYMCAKPGYDGKHAFAKTHSGHSQNAARYRRWLNSEGIMR